MFSQEELLGFQRIMQLLTDLVNAGQDWQIVHARPFRLRWGLPKRFGLAFDLGQNEVTTEKLVWLQTKGCIAQVFNNLIIVAPLEPVNPPASCFHATPVENVALIIDNDLLVARSAGRSTSERKDGAGYIHVTFDLDSARKWPEAHLLGRTKPGQEWAIIQIDSNGLTGRVFRDPASSTGYILEDERVAKEFLKVAETFRPHSIRTT